MLSRLLLLAVLVSTGGVGLAQEFEPLFAERSIAYAPTLSPDGQLLVFQSRSEEDAWRLYLSARQDGQWSDPQVLFDEYPQEVFFGGPCFGYEGHSLWFFSDLQQPGRSDALQLCWTNYDPRSQTWLEPQALPAPLNQLPYQAFPSLSPDGSRLLFVTDPPPVDSLLVDSLGWALPEEGSDCYQILYAEKDAEGHWSEPRPWPGVGDLACVAAPRQLPDGETVVFSAHHPETGFDLYQSRYQPATQSWTPPQPLDQFNSAYDEFFLSARYNGSELLFNRSQTLEADGEVQDMIYFGTDPFGTQVGGWIQLQGEIKGGGGVPLASTLEIREASKEGVLQTMATDSIDGKFEAQVRSGRNYLVTVSAPDHEFYSFSVPGRYAAGPESFHRTVILAPLQKEATIRLDDLNFAYNSAELTDSARAILEVAATLLRDNPDIRVEIAAHTDDIGSADFNQTLSTQRAEAALSVLLEKGVDPDRLIAKGYGESEPVAENETEAGRALNRRVEFRLLEP